MFTKKKRSSLKKFANFQQNAGDLKNKAFAQKFASSLACSNQNNVAHDLGPVSTSQKIVLSSSGGLGIFEDLQASRPRPSS